MSRAVLNRRKMLARTTLAAIASTAAPQLLFSKQRGSRGIVIGERGATPTGDLIFAAGGNAIDAAVAGAFAAGITSPSNCGIGGYGGCAMIGLQKTKQIVCVDFNCVAPIAARPDMYELNERGLAKDRKNSIGWLAAGVPGTLSGLELILKKFGTKSLSEVLQPAIQLAKKAGPNRFVKYDRLAETLETFAKRNSADSIYRGDLAGIIADAFAKHGGLVTREDLARFHAREQEPLRVDWQGASLYGAPLPSGSPTVLQAVQLLKAFGWEKERSRPAAMHARVEMLRLVWKDRLDFYGDPDFASVPMERLLSEAHAAEQADRVRQAVKEQKSIPLQVRFLDQRGTVNLSSVDQEGNVVALTLTHGSSYGAQVVVEEIGMVLGHGMWRFDPQPGHPNSIAPGKRPLHNMSPCILARDGRPVLGVGGAGGTRIENAITDFFSYYMGWNESLEEASAHPRMNCFGLMDVGIEKGFPDSHLDYLKKIGYKSHPMPGAVIGAVEFNPHSSEFRSRLRLGDPLPRLAPAAARTETPLSTGD